MTGTLLMASRNGIRTNNVIRNTINDIWDDYTTGCLFDYTYFKEKYKLIAIDMQKQQVFDTDPKAIQQIDFTGNLEWGGNTMLFINRKR